MALITIDSKYDATKDKFAAVVVPGPGTRVPPLTSAAQYDSYADAVSACVDHLAQHGVRYIDRYAVGALLV